MITGRLKVNKITGRFKKTVEVVQPNLENIEITPSKEEQVFNHPNSDGYDEVRVNAVTSEVDENIIAENIKSDVEILGVKGTFVGAKYKPRFISFYGYTGDNLDYELANLDTSLITDMDRMFYNLENENITTLDLSNFDTTNVTDMSRMFSDCTKLKNLDVSTFNTSNVIKMFSMFSSCYNLVSLDLSNFDTSNVTSMDYMFRSCEALEYLDIRNFTFDKVTSYGYMFQYVPSNCEIIVKSETEKAWVLNKKSDFTNVKTVTEYEGE